MMEVTGYLKLE